MKNIIFFLLCLMSVTTGYAQTDCRLTHKVAKKETIYGISHLYGISEQELVEANPQIAEKGLKKKMELCIPYSKAYRDSVRQEMEARLQAERRAQLKGLKTIRLAVILPFSLNQATPTAEDEKMVDFYRGVLLTVDSLKKEGVNLYIHTFDESTANIRNVLREVEGQGADLIIGPGRPNNVNAVAAFAQMCHVPLVLPFTNSETIVSGRPYVFQCNTLQANHYPKIFKRFANYHKDDNVIVIDMEDRSGDSDYITYFTNALRQNGINYKRVAFANIDEELVPIMSLSQNNALVPSSVWAGSFDMLCLKLNDLNLTADYRLQLFGTPEWQTLTTKSQKNLLKYNATYFSTFFTNTLSTRTKRFCTLFEQSFGKAQYASYPRYAEMGHDISAFFLTALQRYGDKMTEYVHEHDYNSLQLPLHFVRKADQSGFVNTATYIISYKSDGSVNLNTF